ncbi:MAG TPA: cadherin-like domain-containing protein [Gammaproteobacteria bacterium]|nr:cadherin-like domain-containing protein [Gammaproteobacteria bacterium]
MPQTPVSFLPSLELSVLDGIIGTAFNGISANEQSGTSVASAGDINGDGLNDLIIGATLADPGNRTNAGSSFVVFGTNKSFGAAPDLSTLNGINGFRINGVSGGVSGVSSGDYSGYSVASAGDINGDGLSDLIIGAYAASPGGRTNAGSSFVVFGTRSGFGAALELSALNGANGFRINGVSSFDQSGISVAGAGDMNGDGLSDLIIGAYYASPGGRSYAGSSFVVFGTRSSFGAALELSTLNGANGFRINGVSANDYSGISVASAGDMNGDGLSDLIIGAYGADPGNRTSAGSSFVVFGTRSGFGAALELSSLNGANGFSINGVSNSDQSGLSVASAGDINGDSLSDLIIGARNASPDNRTSAGSSFVVFGTRSGFGAALELSSLNGNNGFSINGVSNADYSGRSVASAGDMNGDSLSDLIIGAPNGGRSQAGSSFVVFGDNSSIQLTANQMTTSEGGFQILSPINLNVSVSGGSPNYVYYSISSLVHGKFEYTNQSGVVITRFSYQDVITGRVNFTHDDSELVPSYLVTASHRLAAAISPANITFNNQLPTLVNNSLTINQGQTIQLDNTMLAAVDLDNSQHNPNIIFTISGTSNGVFSSYNFSQRQLWNGEVNFTQDNSIRAPQYTINISRGGVNIGPNFPAIDFDAIPLLGQNRFDICQGQTKALTSNMLSATHPGANSSDTLIFSIKYLQYSQYSHFERISAPGIEISTFSQAEIKNSSIQLVPDGSSNPSNFMLTVSGNRMTTPSNFANLYFTFAPLIRSNALTLNQGQTVVLDKTMLSAVDPNNLSADLMFTVSNVKQGTFIHTNTSKNITQFNQSQLTARQIAFKTDGNSLKPSYLVSVQNKCSQTQATAADINFNSAPVLTNNQLTITNGQPRILTSIELSANDRETPLVELGFTISGIQYGYFDTITLPGTPITVFPQQMVFNGVIRFVPENNIHVPAYNVSVSDGVLWTGSQAALVRLNAPPVNTFSTTVENSNTTQNALIGSAAAVGTIGLAFLGLHWFLKKKTNTQFQKMLLEGTSDAEKAFNKEVFHPIANKIFNVINTTGFFGQRTEADTKAYMMAIGKVVSELRRQNANLDFSVMEAVDKESFINEIASQTRQQSLPKHKGFFRSCTRYLKAEVTPQEIEYAAEEIAFAAVAWQRRHMKGVSARSTGLGIELGKLSNIGFSIEAANEDVPPEKQFKWMQNNMKAMQQEQKRLEEHFAKSEERFTKIETSLEELLGRQPEAAREQPKMRLVR